MKFHFKLGPALRLVEIEERKKKIELGTILQKVSEMQTQIGKTQENIKQLLLISIGTPANNRLVSGEWYEYQTNKIELDRDQEGKLIRNLTDIRGLLSQKRRELAALLLKRKAFENKRESDFKQYRMQVARRDQKQLDENHRLLKAAQRGKQ